MQRILIVPRDLLRLPLGTSLLDRGSLSVRATNSPTTAMTIVSTWQPALVIFGAHIPGADPADFCQQVRDAAADHRPRLLLMMSPDLADGVDPAGLPGDARVLASGDAGTLLRTVAGLLDLRYRRAPRANVRVLAQAEGFGRDEGAGRLLVNTFTLSEVGVLIESPEPLDPASRGTLRLFLPGTSKALSLGCEVHYLVDELQLHYALEILDASPADREVIRSVTEPNRQA
jgi:CheY-like chemotaxis protein